MMFGKIHKKKILIYFGNPHKDSCSGMIADTYEKTAIDAGHEVIRMNMGEMDYDPVLYDGYRSIQQLEPVLLEFQKNVNWADHLVFIYPNWWSTMPAKMKGLFDRSFIPGHAFRFERDREGNTRKKIPALEISSPITLIEKCKKDKNVQVATGTGIKNLPRTTCFVIRIAAMITVNNMVNFNPYSKTTSVLESTAPSKKLNEKTTAKSTIPTLNILYTRCCNLRQQSFASLHKE